VGGIEKQCAVRKPIRQAAPDSASEIFLAGIRMYKYFSSGEKQMPFGSGRVLITSLSLVPRRFCPRLLVPCSGCDRHR